MIVVLLHIFECLLLNFTLQYETSAEVRTLCAGSTGAMVAALRGWSFLVSTLPTYSLSTGFVETSFASLAALLYSENVDTRAAAGEAIALLYDSAGLGQLEENSGDSGGPLPHAPMALSPSIGQALSC